MKKTIFFLFLLLVFASISYAQSDIPIGLQKIIDYNNKSTSDFSLKISFFIAFIAGILGVLSPCILPFLPAYFSYTFKERKNITKMTLVFFLGFASVFISMGAIAGFIGAQSLVAIQKPWVVAGAGVILIILGIAALKGKKVCSFVDPAKKYSNDLPGTFLFGMGFALGWTACLGPILAGILGIGAILHNVLYSSILMLFYSLGNLLPLFVLSMFYDKFNLSESRLIRGKVLSFSVFGKTFNIHSTNLISGGLLLMIGTFLVINKSTSIVNTWDIFGTKEYFYIFQKGILGWRYANIAGIAAFIVFIAIAAIFIYRNNRRR